MIQFNLLPDIKQAYIKSEHTKRLVVGVSVIVSVVALVVFVIMVSTVYVVQKKSISDLNNNIQTNSMALKDTANLTKILTVQSQLNSLSTLNSQSPAASRLFGFLSQLTPTQATISDLQISFTQGTVTINGNAPSLDVVNTYVDDLKYTSYTVGGQNGSTSAFSSVVLASFGFGSSGTATYSITFNFDPTLFNNADVVTLSVGGNQPPTASQQPSIIFSKGN
jgi:Tfp pilus assembly protein PilN